MTNARFDALFGGPPRQPEAPLTQRDMDLAASVQAVTEEIVLKLAHAIAARPASATSASPAASRSTAWPTASCYARAAGSTHLWLQPAAGDAGGAIGAALAAAHLYKQDRAATQATGRHAGIVSRTRLFAGRDRAATASGRRRLRIA